MESNCYEKELVEPTDINIRKYFQFSLFKTRSKYFTFIMLAFFALIYCQIASPPIIFRFEIWR